MSLEGKNIIVTGATSGFGVQMAAELAAAGASVFIGGRRTDRGVEVAKDTKSTFHAVDVADKESSKAFFAAAENHFGGGQNVDLILLNAGVEGEHAKTVIPTMEIETYDYIFGVNVRGVMLGLQYGAPLLRSGGTILVTSSAGSIMPFASNPVYGASKAAVDAMVRSYAAQLASSDDERLKSLSVVTVNPTVYRTEMLQRFVGTDDEQVELAIAKRLNICQRMGLAEELAVIVREFAEGKLPYKSGDNFVADGNTHFPLSEYFARMAEATKVK